VPKQWRNWTMVDDANACRRWVSEARTVAGDVSLFSSAASDDRCSPREPWTDRFTLVSLRTARLGRAGLHRLEGPSYLEGARCTLLYGPFLVDLSQLSTRRRPDATRMRESYQCGKSAAIESTPVIV